jgi:hypothetical protein
MVSMVVGRHSCNRPCVGPAVPLNVPIDKRNNTALIVGIAWKKQNYILLHLHAEIRPANAFRMNVRKQK